MVACWPSNSKVATWLSKKVASLVRRQARSSLGAPARRARRRAARVAGFGPRRSRPWDLRGAGVGRGSTQASSTVSLYPTEPPLIPIDPERIHQSHGPIPTAILNGAWNFESDMWEIEGLALPNCIDTFRVRHNATSVRRSGGRRWWPL